VVKLFLTLVLGGAIAACGWLIEIARGWRYDLAVRRGEDPDRE
jgi:hypothetical protein